LATFTDENQNYGKLDYRIINIGKLDVKRHVILLLILFITFVSLLPSLTNGFQMEWDDQWMVVNSQTVGRPSWYLLLSMFTVPSHGQIAPINQMLYTLLYRCFGFNPAAYHVACFVLHMINVCLLYKGLNIVLRDCTKIASERVKWIVTITVALFAIHPLQVESVAWISASKIPLSTMFYFMGSIMLMNHLRRGGRWWYAGSMLMQLMAYLSKEQAVVFPLFAALLYIWYGVSPKSKRFWVGITPFCILSLTTVIHEIFYVANYDQYIQGETYVWWQRMVFSIYSVITYFFKWLVPINLNWMYLFPVGMKDSMPWWLILYPVLAIFLIYATRSWIKKPLVASLLAFFIIHLLLVIHIIVLPRASVIADRYMYISIISLNFLFAYIVTGIKPLMRHKRLSIAIVSLIIAVLMGLSYTRTTDWKDSKTLRSVFAVESSSMVK